MLKVNTVYVKWKYLLANNDFSKTIDQGSLQGEIPKIMRLPV